MMRLRRASVIAVLTVLISVATAHVETRGADMMVTGMESGYWLTAYEHAEREWNTMAGSWVHGFLNAATMFGGIQCPQALSARTLAAATADTIKQRQRPKEDAAVAVLFAARRLDCSVDTEAMRRGADLLQKKWGTK